MLSSVAVRQWLSPLVAVLFTSIAVTGILMWFDVHAPGIKGLHEFGGLAFAAVGLVHLLSNWRALAAYFRKAQAWMAVGVGAVVCAGLLAGAVLGGGDGERGEHGRHERRGAQAAAGGAQADREHGEREH